MHETPEEGRYNSDVFLGYKSLPVIRTPSGEKIFVYLTCKKQCFKETYLHDLSGFAVVVVVVGLSPAQQ